MGSREDLYLQDRTRRVRERARIREAMAADDQGADPTVTLLIHIAETLDKILEALHGAAAAPRL